MGDTVRPATTVGIGLDDDRRILLANDVADQDPWAAIVEGRRRPG
jgi:hypothetical protein